MPRSLDQIAKIESNKFQAILLVCVNLILAAVVVGLLLSHNEVSNWTVIFIGSVYLLLSGVCIKVILKIPEAKT